MDPINEHIKSLRTDYNLENLDESTAFKDPFMQFGEWMKKAVTEKVNEPNAMSLATVSQNGKPSSRIVLLRNFDSTGFVFYTNYESHKARELMMNGHAALNFFWPELHRQVRIEGISVRISEAESDAYFDSRPRESQLGAWVSQQSSRVSSRAEMDQKYDATSLQYEGKPVKRPPFWGGFRVIPDSFEFWQGRPSRLHDRLQYRLEGNSWVLQRLYP